MESRLERQTIEEPESHLYLWPLATHEKAMLAVMANLKRAGTTVGFCRLDCCSRVNSNWFIKVYKFWLEANFGALCDSGSVCFSPILVCVRVCLRLTFGSFWQFGKNKWNGIISVKWWLTTAKDGKRRLTMLSASKTTHTFAPEIYENKLTLMPALMTKIATHCLTLNIEPKN